jgi:tRNA 2-thiouridine synthesizing protein E
VSRTIKFNNKTYTVDDFGFLNPSEQWDENFAEGMAKQLGIYNGLTVEHWKFINYLRKKFLEEKTVPVVVHACADNNFKLQDMRRLFPTGYHRGACKIAGINYKFMFETNHWLTYETPRILGSKYKMTSTGFLENFEDWDEDFAHFVINEWGLSSGLTEKHRRIIAYLRKSYKKNKNIPTVFDACENNQVSLSELRELFPEGYRRGACRVAGLPFFA